MSLPYSEFFGNKIGAFQELFNSYDKEKRGMITEDQTLKALESCGVYLIGCEWQLVTFDDDLFHDLGLVTVESFLTIIYRFLRMPNLAITDDKIRFREEKKNQLMRDIQSPESSINVNVTTEKDEK